jgi:hypothetical protein
MFSRPGPRAWPRSSRGSESRGSELRDLSLQVQSACGGRLGGARLLLRPQTSAKDPRRLRAHGSKRWPVVAFSSIAPSHRVPARATGTQPPRVPLRERSCQTHPAAMPRTCPLQAQWLVAVTTDTRPGQTTANAGNARSVHNAQRQLSSSQRNNILSGHPRGVQRRERHGNQRSLGASGGLDAGGLVRRPVGGLAAGVGGGRDGVRRSWHTCWAAGSLSVQPH